jgi:hypothetical protein
MHALQGGIISFHDTAPDCPVQNQQQHPFANGECIANAPGFGAVAFSVACNPDVPTNPAVPDGNFAAEWFEEADCALTAAGHQTIVVGAQDLCQVVPQRQTVAGANDNNNNNNNNDNNNNNNNNNQQPAPSNLPTANFNTLAGYSVQCFADGTGGVVRFSSTGTCDNVQASTPFQSGVCLANPAQFGSASVKFFCAGRTTAQQPTTHARLTWYEDGSCNVDDNNHRTIVVARQGFCQRVPDRDLGYRITCEADQNGNQNGKGTVQFCDANCGSCPFVHNLDSNVCTANAAGYGSAAYKLSCQPADVNNTPTIGDVVVKWIEEANCANEATHFTQLILPQTLWLVRLREERGAQLQLGHLPCSPGGDQRTHRGQPLQCLHVNGSLRILSNASSPLIYPFRTAATLSPMRPTSALPATRSLAMVPAPRVCSTCAMLTAALARSRPPLRTARLATL